MNMSINFPHLGIYLEHVGKSISIHGFSIAYYGIIMGCSILLGLYLAEREAKRTGQNPDTYTDLVIYAIVVSIICARTYYVIFSWDSYKNDLLSIFNLRQGGIAIYGAVIGAVATVYVYSRVKKLSFPVMLDTACRSWDGGVISSTEKPLAVIQTICLLCSFRSVQCVSMRLQMRCGHMYRS